MPRYPVKLEIIRDVSAAHEEEAKSKLKRAVFGSPAEFLVDAKMSILDTLPEGSPKYDRT